MLFKPEQLARFRTLLMPLAWAYGAIIRFRNWCYDKNILRSTSFNLPLICVGNLSVGGTGKSPMVEYLIRLLKDQWQLAVLSRGYKRRSRGYLMADERTTAVDIGDEPMQFHIKFPDITVAAGEERVVAIPLLLYDRPGTRVIILDDAYQHRSVRAGLNLLLTDNARLYTRDYLLPAGTLRDERKSSARANIIIVTKCDPDLSEQEKDQMVKELAPLPHQHVFFSAIQYTTPYHLVTGGKREITRSDKLLLICGIANPAPLRAYLAGKASGIETLLFRDHYIYTIRDLRKILKQFEAIDSIDKCIITTEKDAVRLVKFKQELREIPVYVLPMEVVFLFKQEKQFNDLILNFIQNFRFKK